MLYSTNRGKSDSNWLDRLRSNEGFPTDDNLDLDHFLQNSRCGSPIDSPANCGSAQFDEDKRAADQDKGEEDLSEKGRDETEWFGIMSNVLSELFNMGDPNEVPQFSVKKGSRKQTNPRMCVVSGLESNDQRGVREDGDAPVMISVNSDDNSVEVKAENCCVEEEKEKGDKDLVGFSRSEVTVIDTSCEMWKFDKLVLGGRMCGKLGRRRRSHGVLLEGRRGKLRVVDWMDIRRKLRFGVRSLVCQRKAMRRSFSHLQMKDRNLRSIKVKKSAKVQQRNLTKFRKRGFLFPNYLRNYEKEAHLLSS